MRSPASFMYPGRRRRGGWRAARLTSLAVVGLGAVLALPAVSAEAAQPPVGLATARSFAVLAGSGITNTGSTTITGDIGTFPTPTETGFGAMTIIGTDYAGGPVTQQAKTDLTTAYNEAAGATPPTSVATELGGTTLTPGIYRGGTLGITGTLTLDTEGDPNAVFIFQSASTLVTASNSSVVVLNGLLACNVFWQIGSSATLGTGSALVGTVLAATSITATTAATVRGRLLALNGAVTLDTNTIGNAGCTNNGTTTTTSGGAAPTTTSGGAAPTTTSSGAAPTTTSSGAAPTTTSSGAAPTTTSSGAGGAPAPTTVPGTLPGPTPTNGSGIHVVTTTTGPLTTGATTTTGVTTTTGTTTSTTGKGRPPLPYTGSDPRLPLSGLLLVAAGGVMVGLSRRRDLSR